MTVTFKFESLDTPFEADWPVTVQVPRDGGTFEEQVFMARFRMLSVEDTTASTEAGENAQAFMRRYFVGLGGGETLTDELFTKLFIAPHTQRAIFNAWAGFQAGAPAKN